MLAPSRGIDISDRSDRMDMNLQPPAQTSEVAMHLRIHGWRWDDNLLHQIVSELANEDVCDMSAFVDIRVDDFECAEAWPDDVKVFIAEVAKVRLVQSISCEYVVVAGRCRLDQIGITW